MTLLFMKDVQFVFPLSTVAEKRALRAAISDGDYSVLPVL